MPVVTFAVKDKEADVRAEKPPTLTPFQTTVLITTPLGRLEARATPDPRTPFTPAAPPAAAAAPDHCRPATRCDGPVAV